MEFIIPSRAGTFLTPNTGNPLCSLGDCLVVQEAGTAWMQHKGVCITCAINQTGSQTGYVCYTIRNCRQIEAQNNQSKAWCAFKSSAISFANLLCRLSRDATGPYENHQVINKFTF